MMARGSGARIAKAYVFVAVEHANSEVVVPQKRMCANAFSYLPVTAVEAEHGSEGSLNVCFAPKATELLRCREMTRCATTHALQQ